MIRRSLKEKEYNTNTVGEIIDYDLRGTNFVKYENRIYKQMK